MIKQPKKEISRREALWKMILGGAVLAGGAGVATMIFTSNGCRQTKQEYLEKKLTNFNVMHACFGPDDKVYYAITGHNVFVLSIKEPTVKIYRDEEALLGIIQKPKDAKIFTALVDQNGNHYSVAGRFCMCATKYGVAVISGLPPEYRGKYPGNDGLLWVFTPDGKLVSSKNIEDRITSFWGMMYGDEKGFYGIPIWNYETRKSIHNLFPIDGSKPTEQKGEPPGWEEYLEKRYEALIALFPEKVELRKLKGKGGIDSYIRDIRETEGGIELLYNKEKHGLCYRLIPKEKLSGGK